MAQTFSCLVDDRRYSVPTLIPINAEDEASARRQAMQALFASHEHTAVELHAEAGMVFRRERETSLKPRTFPAGYAPHGAG